MRGTREYSRIGIRLIGIIPAYAGNTARAWATRARGGDHPRVCGEHFASLRIRRTIAGSSPRMRGTLSKRFPHSSTSGIIPAYAGNTSRPPTTVAEAWDHPRVCGEHSVWPSRYLIRVGSSPRMRGTLVLVGLCWLCLGIIPAYAGNTIHCMRASGNCWDHPRVCGEHIGLRHLIRYQPGSSPRMRGTHPGSDAGRAPAGIIPAYAGNTP